MTSLSILLAAAHVLTLTQAESNTRDNLPAIRLAVAQTAAQAAVRDQAFSYYLPQFAASASFYPLNLTTGGNLSGQGSGSAAAAKNLTSVITSQTSSFGANVTQLIWDVNQTLDKIRQNDVLIAAQKDNEAVVWNGVLLTTRAAYFNCQQNLELIRVAQENLDDQKKHVDEMAAFVKTGTHTEVDLAQAKQQAAAAMFQLIQAKGNYLVSKAALQQAMGIDAPPDFDVTTDLFPPVSGEDSAADALLPEAIAARPEMKNLLDQIQAQQYAISWNRESWAPALNAYGSASGIWSKTDVAGAGPASTTPSIKAGLLLSWQFWQGGIAQAQTRQAEAQLVELQAQYDTEKQQVRNDVDNGRIAIATARGQLDSSQEALAYAREQLRLADAQYKAGVGIALAVFDAEVAVYTAGGQVAQSVDALATGRAQLIRALGREKY